MASRLRSTRQTWTRTASQPGGFDKIRGVGTRAGNHISGTFKVDGVDGAGNPTFSATGTLEGQRIVVEPL
ncbi:MAG: hypothetical protein ABJD24_18715 [Acidimicrobiales bacterium]